MPLMEFLSASLLLSVLFSAVSGEKSEIIQSNELTDITDGSKTQLKREKYNLQLRGAAAPLEAVPIAFLGAGTFGCTFKPALLCPTELSTYDPDVQYLSKVVNTAEDGEIRMGEMIMQIPQYESFFAPVLQSCQMDLSGVSDEEIEKCSIITTSANTSQFISNTMRYVGTESLYSYLTTQVLKSDLEGMKALFATHIHTLKALIKLQDAKIVHFDIKENNVIFDEKNGVPVIIDFGFSFTEKKLFESKRDDDLNYFFWSYQYERDDSFVIDWSVEVDLLNYITQIHLIQNRKSLDVAINDDDIRELQNTVDRYITKIDLTDRKYFTDLEVDQYRSAYHEYLFSFSGYTMRTLVLDLKESWQFWDNYALARTYSEFLRYLLQRKKNWREIPFIALYTDIVKKTVFGSPGYRFGPEDTLFSLENLMQNV